MFLGQCERSLPTPRRGNYAGSYKMPRVNMIKHGLTTQGHSISIHTKGLSDEKKCPGVQGHEDFMQVQYTQGQFHISESPPCRCMLFSKEETEEALQKIREKPECNAINRPPPEPDMGPHSLEEYAFMGSKVQSYTPQGKAPPEFNELKGQSSLGIARLSARKEAKLHAFLKANGGFALRHTQDLGNCLYAAVLRGTDCKREFTTMHLRRMLVLMVSQYPKFFSKYLSRPLGLVYGQARLASRSWPRERERAPSQQRIFMMRNCQDLFLSISL